MQFKLPKKKILDTLQALKKSNVIKNLFVYSFGSLLLRGINILATPITTRILSTQDYAIISLAGSFAWILAVALGLGLRNFFSMKFVHLDKTEKKTTLNNIILLYLAFSLPVSALLCLFSRFVNKIVFSGSAPNILIIAYVLYTFFAFFSEFFFDMLGLQQKAKRLAFIQVSAAILTTAPTLIFLCLLGWGVMGIIVGQLIGTLFVCVIALRSYFKKTCHKHVNVKQFKKSYPGYLKIGLAFIPSNLCLWALASIDRFALKHYSTFDDVAIYSLASTFGVLFQLLILFPVQRIYIPAALKKFVQNKNDLRPAISWNYKNMVISMITLVVLASGGYIVGKPILMIILPKTYHPSLSYVWLILMGYIFLLGEHFTSVQILYHKKVRFHSLSLFIPAVVNFGLNIALVPHFGITGCVIATLISYCCYFVIKLAYNFFLEKQTA